jgi:hypothetical protein
VIRLFFDVGLDLGLTSVRHWSDVDLRFDLLASLCDHAYLVPSADLGANFHNSVCFERASDGIETTPFLEYHPDLTPHAVQEVLDYFIFFLFSSNLCNTRYVGVAFLRGR